MVAVSFRRSKLLISVSVLGGRLGPRPNRASKLICILYMIHIPIWDSCRSYQMFMSMLSEFKGLAGILVRHYIILPIHVEWQIRRRGHRQTEAEQTDRSTDTHGLTNIKSWAVGLYRTSLLIIFSTGSTSSAGSRGAISPNSSVNWWQI